MLYQSLSNCYIFEFQWEKAIDVLKKVLNNIEFASISFFLIGIREKNLKTNPWSIPWLKLKLGALYYTVGKGASAAVTWQEVIEYKGSGKCNNFFIYLM